MKLGGVRAGKNLEILILIISFHLIFPKVRMESWHLALSNLEREMEYVEPNHHRVSCVGFCHR